MHILDGKKSEVRSKEKEQGEREEMREGRAGWKGGKKKKEEERWEECTFSSERFPINQYPGL